MSEMDSIISNAIQSVVGGGAAGGEDSTPVDPDLVFKSTGLSRGEMPAAKPAAKVETTADADDAAAADEVDPLDESLYADELLDTPEKLKEARARLFKHLGKVNELTRKAHRAHAAGEKREQKIEKREQSVTLREQAAAAYDRAQQANMLDLESGDVDRVLTGLHRLSKVGDPAGLWRNIMLKIASGGKFNAQEQAAAQADPEIQRRLAMVENVLQNHQSQSAQAQAAAEEAAIEQAKARNLQAAAQNTATPRVVAYASDPRTADATREALAEIMVSMHRQHGRPIDIGRACAILEENLAVHYELSQRADGKTNGEKGTTGSEPDAGRATSTDSPPKPGARPTTIPTTLSAAPGTAKRPLTEAEQKAATVQALEASGFFSRFGM